MALPTTGFGGPLGVVLSTATRPTVHQRASWDEMRTASLMLETTPGPEHYDCEFWPDSHLAGDRRST